MLICKYCSRELSRPCGLVIHEKACNSNPDRVPQKNQYTNGGVCSEETKRKLSSAGKGRKHSEETKKKISEHRIKYLKENPEKVPYRLNHYSKGESYPEKFWREVLTNANINFVQEKNVSIYRLDFAINETLDLEIDGEQHYVDKRILMSNQRRDEELRRLGWKVLRVRWSEFQKLQDSARSEYVCKIIQECILASTD